MKRPHKKNPNTFGLLPKTRNQGYNQALEDMEAYLPTENEILTILMKDNQRAIPTLTYKAKDIYKRIHE